MINLNLYYNLISFIYFFSFDECNALFFRYLRKMNF